MSNIYRGSCLCGQVTFSVSGFSQQAAHCHCSMCRKFHGAAFGTLVAVEGLNWLSDETLLQHYTAANGTTRTFCGCCGSSLGFRTKDKGLNAIELAIATFDDAIPVIIDAHIYTDTKACWYSIDDGLPAFVAGRESSI